MMELVNIIYDGVKLIVPKVNGEPLPMPHNGFEDFDTYCGPGWLGDKLVPDTLFGVNISPACYIHDVMNGLAGDREEDHQGNVVFRKNMFTILEYFEPKPSWKDKHHFSRYFRALVYYESVDTVGLRDDS